MHQQKTLALTLIQIAIQRKLIHTNDTVHRGTNLVRRVRQELQLGAIGKFGSFTSGGVLLNRLAQVVQNLIDLMSLKGFHLA